MVSCRPFCEAHSRILEQEMGTRITEKGQRARRTRSEIPHLPVLEEEDLPTDLRDAIEDDVLFADLRSDGAQCGRGAGASVNVRGGPWRRTPDLRLRLSAAPGVLPTRLSP